MSRSGSIACGFALLLGEFGWAQGTERVQVNWFGLEAGASAEGVSISQSGRFVAFYTDATNLVAGDTNGVRDIYVRDRLLGTNELVSVSSTGVQGNDYSIEPKISPDGRFVVFQSGAWNLVAGDTNGCADIFVRDRENGTTERVSVNTAGVQGDATSFTSAITPNGRFVAFASFAGNLAAVDLNGSPDVFVRDRVLQVTELISVGAGGTAAGAWSNSPSISADGNFVAFESEAGFVAPDTNQASDIFVRDRFFGTFVRVSQPNNTGTTQGNGPSNAPAISAGGDYVAFGSYATNLVSGDTNGASDIFVRARTGSTPQRLSVSSAGAQGNGNSWAGCSISADGRFVSYSSEATNLVAGDTNAVSDIFLRDRQLNVTERISVDSYGVQGNSDSYESSINADGRFVAFTSYATNLVMPDNYSLVDAFMRDRIGGTNFTSLCHPRYSETMSCPCGNPPSGWGRGCNNSANTGGAILSATGWASLASDTLTLTTSGETASAMATSVVLQGNAGVNHGFAWGQGVRCCGGWLRRLYAKIPVGGSITVPDLSAGDPTVSAASAIAADTIHPGESRWYAVWYRDPVFNCGSDSNSTQTGEVIWGP